MAAAIYTFFTYKQIFAGQNKSISLKHSTKQQCKMMWLCLLTVLALYVVNFALTFALIFGTEMSQGRTHPHQWCGSHMVHSVLFFGIFFDKKQFWQVKKCFYIPLAYWKNKIKQKNTQKITIKKLRQVHVHINLTFAKLSI